MIIKTVHLEPDTVEQLRTWLSNRRQLNDDINHYKTNLMLQSSDALRHYSLPELHLNRFSNVHFATRSTVELHKLLACSSKLLALFKDHRQIFEAIECIKLQGNAALASYNVQEAGQVLQGAMCCESPVGLRVGQMDCVLVEDAQVSLQELMLQVCVRLFSQCPVKLVARADHYLVCLASCLLVDLFHEAGLDVGHLQLLVQDTRRADFLAGDQNACLFGSPYAVTRSASERQSSVAICLESADTWSSVPLIMRTYARSLQDSPNMIVLVEESIYYHFHLAWKDNFERLLAADATTLNIQVDLNSIDIGLAHRMSGHCINVIRFRTVNELFRLIKKLQRIRYVQVSCANPLQARELFLWNINQASILAAGCSNEFWINHLPASLSGKRFSGHLLDFYRDSLGEHMNEVYTHVFQQYEMELDRLKRAQTAFMRGAGAAAGAQQRNKAAGKASYRQQEAMRVQQVMCAYLGLITKLRSMKRAALTIGASVARLKQFQLSCLQYFDAIALSDSGEASCGCARREIMLRPIGVAVLVCRDKTCVRSKSTLIDFIFKNLIIGNGVLLICPINLLGARFPHNLLQMFSLPFKHIELKIPDRSASPLLGSETPGGPLQSLEVSALSGSSDCSAGANSFGHSPSSDADSYLDAFSTPGMRFLAAGSQAGAAASKPLKCPKSVYALEFKASQELSSGAVDTLVQALGTRRPSLWYPPAHTLAGTAAPMHEDSSWASSPR